MIDIFVDPKEIDALIEFQRDNSFVFESSDFLSGVWMPGATGSAIMGAGEC